MNTAISDMNEAISKLNGAWIEMRCYGTHEGPCDNRGEGDKCARHAYTMKNREKDVTEAMCQISIAQDGLRLAAIRLDEMLPSVNAYLVAKQEKQKKQQTALELPAA